ncbi:MULTISPECIES: hypothetical protein [Virgibacillus]|uniref:DUF4181 domain-containing protein n=2 Tax=Virgibacillus TaxID=84406 RepID=A0A024Q7P9_9BACI|nr:MULTISPECIES: hypothetical protein [Virgibacillus]EQB38240.1 hypothetical protein M948_06590 [Virgibacillus sp. CM-4]MYL40946.1 hypothetical protein [Virgibacillus massiliensis]GGJ53045.1 hypothetical protein GCM10007111_14050 [Virgibacillus kapii]CDQ38255.1 hypothetical protein BN990_00524 [Virgibacillus massiliensis]
MKRPYEKFILIELISLIGAAVIGLIAMIKAYTVLIFFCILLVIVSLACDAWIDWNTYKSQHALKQAARALLILLFSIFFVFQL